MIDDSTDGDDSDADLSDGDRELKRKLHPDVFKMHLQSKRQEEATTNNKGKERQLFRDSSDSDSAAVKRGSSQRKSRKASSPAVAPRASSSKSKGKHKRKSPSPSPPPTPDFSDIFKQFPVIDPQKDAARRKRLRGQGSSSPHTSDFSSDKDSDDEAKMSKAEKKRFEKEMKAMDQTTKQVTKRKKKAVDDRECTFCRLLLSPLFAADLAMSLVDGYSNPRRN